MKPRGLLHSETEKFYDAFGARQDGASYYEDVTLAELSRFARFESAASVVEFGCGTGRFAEEMLSSSAASYWGCDVSATMIQLSRKRLTKFGERVTLLKSSGETMLPLQDESCDRFVSNYVLDILSMDEIESVLREVKRILKPDGLLCLTGLTFGKGLFSKAWTAFWNLRFDLNPNWVGGCRPVALTEFLSGWELVYHNVVKVGGISSEVVVAKKRPWTGDGRQRVVNRNCRSAVCRPWSLEFLNLPWQKQIPQQHNINPQLHPKELTRVMYCYSILRTR